MRQAGSVGTALIDNIELSTDWECRVFIRTVFTKACKYVDKE